MSNQPDPPGPYEAPRPDGTQPPPTDAPSVPYPTSGADAPPPPPPTSGGPRPPTFQPGYAPLPPPQPEPEPYYPPTSQFPPQPGWGPPPPAAPLQQGYGPPQRAPRKSNAPLIAVLVAVTLLLCAGVATAGVLAARSVTNKAKEVVKPITDPTFPALPTDAPEIPDLPTELPTLPTDIPGLPGSGKSISVTYEVTGDGPVDIIYTEKLGDGPKKVEDPKLPWKFSTTMEGSALVSVTAVRSSGDQGEINCRATVDGAEVAQKSGEGPYATASCIKVVIG